MYITAYITVDIIEETLDLFVSLRSYTTVFGYDSRLAKEVRGALSLA